MWYQRYYPRYKKKKIKVKPSERKKFGQTFWGIQWLNSLKGIDYSNRLSRGSAYANNGSVLKYALVGNTITAIVQGSMPKPYDITIEVPPFKKKEKEKIIGMLASNPAWVAELLNRKLPNDLLVEAAKHNIKLFPSAWNDFKMHCSCPDWAVPCKHLAAVIYILSYEIDLNPMLVLNLHDLDVAAELKKKSNIDLNRNAIEEIPQLAEDIIYVKSDALPKCRKTDDISFDNFDYTYFPETDSSLLELLSEETPFSSKNAKKELIAFFNSARRNLKNIHSEAFVLTPQSLRACIDARICISAHDIIPQIKLIFENETKDFPFGDFVLFLKSTECPDTGKWCFLLKTMYEINNFCLHLLSSGNVIPYIIRHEKMIRVLWRPLLHDENIRNILDKFNPILPPQVLLFEGSHPHETGYSEKTNVELICALFITSLIQKTERSYFTTKERDPLRDAFYGLDSKLLSESSTVNAIQLWLKKLHITRTRITPVIKVEENYPEFKLSIYINDASAHDSPPIGYKMFREDRRYEKEQMSVMQNLMLLAGHFKGLAELVNNPSKTHLSYAANEFSSILFGMIPALRLLGVEILLPKILAKISSPRLSLAINSKSGEKPRSFLVLKDMLNFKWQIAVGDELLNPDEFFSLLGSYSGLVKIKDQYVMLNAEELQKLKKKLESPPRLDGDDMVRTLLSEEYDDAPVGIDPALVKLIRQWTKPDEEKLPKNLRGELRPYQIRGYAWLCKNSRLGVGSILADDMGLGKTIQTIAFLLNLKQNGALEKEKALVIVPTTLLTNWTREIDKFSTGLSYFIYHGLNRDSEEIPKYDVTLTSYGMLRREPEIFIKRAWNVIVIDEAQNIKNNETQQTKALKKIKAPVRIALSGTPVENRMGEYWSIMDFTNKGMLGNANFFSKHFANPIQSDRNHQRLEAFKKITAPFIMRRLKSDKSIISDLPDKIENNIVSSLTNVQAALYKSVVNECLEEIEKSEGIERRGLVLKMMTALKQIGNHPAQYLKNKKFKPEDSGKLQLLFDLVEPIIENGEKLLLFTQYKQMGDLLERALNDKFSVSALFLHGGLSRKKRDEMVHAFQEYKHHSIFILSLKAGGTGLNLTAAANVIHYDLWWNPAVENQATDRAYRIGQKKNVIVYRLINKGTLEEKIDEMIHSKKQLAEMTVAVGEQWIGDLSHAELKEIVTLTKH